MSDTFYLISKISQVLKIFFKKKNKKNKKIATFNTWIHSKIIIKDTLLIILLIIITYITWKDLTQLVIRGDGFVYMTDHAFQTQWKPPLTLLSYDIAPLLLGRIFTRTFGVNMAMYYWAMIIGMFAINTLFYLLIKTVTKKRIIAFSATLLLAVNYFGNWNMYAQGVYATFQDRMFNMVFMIPSFLFLHLYLEKSKVRYIIISLLLYFIGVGTAHWFIIFTAPFFLYPIFWHLFQKFDIKKISKGVILGVIYFGLSEMFAIMQRTVSPIGPTIGTMEFINGVAVNQFPFKMILQLVYASSYSLLLNGLSIADFYYDVPPQQHLFDVKGAIAMIPAVSVVYVLAFIFIYKTLPRFRALLLSIVLGVAAIFFLNVYLGRYDILYQPGFNRYLHLPIVLLAIFWALFLWTAFFKRKNVFLRIIGLFFLIFYFLVNYWLIKENFKQLISIDASTKKVYSYIFDLRHKLAKNTLVITPYPETGVYEGTIFTDLLGKKEVRFMYEGHFKLQKIESSYSHIVKLFYNKSCKCVTEKTLK